MKEIPDYREKEREKQKKEKGKERKTKPRGRMCVPPRARQTQTTADLDVTDSSRRNPPLCTFPACPIRGLNSKTRKIKRKQLGEQAIGNSIYTVHWIPGINFGFLASLQQLVQTQRVSSPLTFQWFSLTLSETNDLILCPTKIIKRESNLLRTDAQGSAL